MAEIGIPLGAMATAFGTTDQEKRRARPLPWYGWVALFSLVAGELALFLRVFAVQVLFYCIAWWSYIVLADAWVWKRRGHSLLRDRPWEFVVLAFSSVTIWNLFEVFNFRLQNWFYVNVPTECLYGAIFTFFAYATVVPGLFETYDLLRAHGVAERVRMRPWQIRRSGLALSVLVGLGMLISPILWPRYGFPWVWGFVVFLLDPLCYRAGRTRAESLLGQFERGDPRPFIRLLLSGLICGGLWEFWNYWAYTKWIYTVPFFEDLKWFEMPPLGFLGFPPFALECYVLVNLLNRFRRGRGWEEPGQIGPGAPMRLAAVAVVLACLFNAAVYVGIDRLTIQSYSPTLASMDGVPRNLVDRLSRVGIVSSHALLQRTASREQLTALARQTGIAEAELQALRTAATLVDLGGLGAAHYNELRRLGIMRVEGLALQDPEALVTQWRSVAGEKPPTLAQVKAWVRAARARMRAFGSSPLRSGVREFD
jgi:hypothetical protein